MKNYVVIFGHRTQGCIGVLGSSNTTLPSLRQAFSYLFIYYLLNHLLICLFIHVSFIYLLFIHLFIHSLSFIYLFTYSFPY